MRAFLETERLLLRPFAETDVDRLLALHSDPEVMRFINGGKPTSREEVEREYRERFAGDGYWAPSRRPPGSSWGGSPSTRRKGTAPRGTSSATGSRGSATEGSRVLIRNGFAELGVRRVWAQTMAVNLASRRVMEKAGLAYVRTFRLEWKDPLPGTEHGEVEYALTKDDWERREEGGSGRRGAAGRDG